MAWSCSKHEIDESSQNWTEIAAEVAEQLDNRSKTPCPICVQNLIRLNKLVGESAELALGETKTAHDLLDAAGIKGVSLAERIELLVNLVKHTGELVEIMDRPALPENSFDDMITKVRRIRLEHLKTCRE